MVIYIICLKSKSAFSKIGKATTDEITAKLVGKTCGYAANQSVNFEHFYAFREVFFSPILNENLLLLNFLSRFFHLVAFISEF